MRSTPLFPSGPLTLMVAMPIASATHYSGCVLTNFLLLNAWLKVVVSQQQSQGVKTRSSSSMIWYGLSLWWYDNDFIVGCLQYMLIHKGFCKVLVQTENSTTYVPSSTCGHVCTYYKYKYWTVISEIYCMNSCGIQLIKHPRASWRPLKLSMASSQRQRAVCCSASRSLCSGQRQQCQRAKWWKWVSAQSHSGCKTYITLAPVQTYRGRESRGELQWRHLTNLNLDLNSSPLFTHRKCSVTSSLSILCLAPNYTKTGGICYKFRYYKLTDVLMKCTTEYDCLLYE